MCNDDRGTTWYAGERTMKALAHALTPFLLLGLAQPGCKKKPDLPPALSYALETKDLSLAGSTLVVLGQRVVVPGAEG